MNKTTFTMLGFLMVVACSLVYGATVIVPATQIEKGKTSVSLFYGHSVRDVSLTIGNKEEIKVNTNSYFSDVSNDLVCSTERDEIAVKFVVNPHNDLYYWATLGAGSYEIQIPSVTVTNELTNRNRGWIAGVGFRSQLFPDTIVTPAIAVEMGIDYRSYHLDSFKSGQSVAATISNTLNSTEIQLACLMSKEYARFEPYGGLKVFRTYTTILDAVSLGKVSGIKDNASVFVGSKVKVYDKESLVIEGSFVGETSVAIGWNIEF